LTFIGFYWGLFERTRFAQPNRLSSERFGLPGAKSLDDHAGVKTQVIGSCDCRFLGPHKKVSQEIIRPCWRRIAALLRKQLLFCPRCVMSARPQQPVA
jgi:hypothetical protein